MVKFKRIKNGANSVDGCENQFDDYMFREGHWFKMNNQRTFDPFNEHMADGKLHYMLKYIITINDAPACLLVHR